MPRCPAPRLLVRCTAPPTRRPSFPTRRSSDLPAAHRKGGRTKHTGPGGCLSPLHELFLEARIVLGFHQRGRQTRRLQCSAAHLRSEEHTSELQSREKLVCRLLLEINNNDHLRN